MLNKKNIVLIGGGYWGTNIAINLIKLGIKTIYLYDTKLKNSRILKKRFPKKIKLVKNIEDLLNNKDYKYFIYATPPSINFSLISKALKKNKIIFVEKPGFKNFTEIVKISKKYPIASKRLMFGYIYMFNEHINYLKKFISNKKNGKILYMKFQRQNLGPIRNDVDVSHDLSSHDISILNYLFGNKIKIIRNLSYKLLNNKVSDISNLSLKINNFYADINNSWLNPDKIRRIIIITQKKMLLFDEMLTDNKIKIFNKYAAYPKIELLKNNFFSRKIKIHDGKNFLPKVKSNDPFCDELKNFLSLNSKKPKINKFSDIIFAKNILRILEGKKTKN